MRKLPILALLLILAASTAYPARRAALSRTYFTPPPTPGVIYAVIDYARSSGTAQGTVVNVEWGNASRTITVGAPYQGSCAETTPAGFVLKLRHPRPDTTPLTITTTGTIVRPPYQGDLPPETLAACYKLVS
jgi:hypothetical protein